MVFQIRASVRQYFRTSSILYIAKIIYYYYVFNIMLQKHYSITVWQPVAVLKVPKSGKQPTLVRISIAKQIRNGPKRRPGTRPQKAKVTVTENYSLFFRIRYHGFFSQGQLDPFLAKFRLAQGSGAFNYGGRFLKKVLIFEKKGGC